jgi:PAS domain-containing protein
LWGGGIRNFYVTLLFPFVVVAGLTLGRRAGLITLYVILAVAAALALLHASGRLPEPIFQMDDLSAYLTLLLSLISMVVPFNVALRELNERLAFAHRQLIERQKAQDALQMREQQLRTILSNLPIIVFGLDSQGVFTLTEGKGLENLKMKPGQLDGRSVFSSTLLSTDAARFIRQALAGTAGHELVEFAPNNRTRHFWPI